MSHVHHQQAKLARRVARIRGQLDAVTRALENQTDCGEVLRLIASARGAMNGLMAEVIEDHIQAHVVRGAASDSEQGEAAAELIEVIRTYLR
jgi:DNA-binding FrmR family transcriptional regulator